MFAILEFGFCTRLVRSKYYVKGRYSQSRAPSAMPLERRPCTQAARSSIQYLFVDQGLKGRVSVQALVGNQEEHQGISRARTEPVTSPKLPACCSPSKFEEHHRSTSQPDVVGQFSQMDPVIATLLVDRGHHALGIEADMKGRFEKPH